MLAGLALIPLLFFFGLLIYLLVRTITLSRRVDELEQRLRGMEAIPPARRTEKTAPATRTVAER